MTFLQNDILTIDILLNSIRPNTFYQMTFHQMTLYHITFHQITFYQMTFYQIIFNQITFKHLIFEQSTSSKWHPAKCHLNKWYPTKWYLTKWRNDIRPNAYCHPHKWHASKRHSTKHAIDGHFSNSHPYPTIQYHLHLLKIYLIDPTCFCIALGSKDKQRVGWCYTNKNNPICIKLPKVSKASTVSVTTAAFTGSFIKKLSVKESPEIYLHWLS